MKRLLLTGAAGFIGSHVLRHILTNTDWHVVCPVTFRHKGMPDRIVEQMQDHPEWHERVTIVRWDLTAHPDRLIERTVGAVDLIVNFASESHVDRSIADPVGFISNNVEAMLTMLEFARRIEPEAFLQISTDEVYGPAPAGYAHAEWDVILPSNPYAASKAAQEAIAISYWRTYGVPLILTNCMNLIGEMQDEEKMVPMTIAKLRRGEPITVHGRLDEGGWTASSRFYLHARNLADAVLFLLNRGKITMLGDDGATRPDRWHVVGEREVPNDELVHTLAEHLGVEANIEYLDFHSSRPGHDMRYALDGTKLREAGWVMPIGLDDSLRKTVEWTVAHPKWGNLR